MKKKVVCIGGSLVDESLYCFNSPITGTSNPASLERSPGGVCRNVAHHLAMLKHDVELITLFGNDPEGVWLKEQCKNAGIGMNHSAVIDGNTGRFIAVLDPEGSLFAGVVVNDLEPFLNQAYLELQIEAIRNAAFVITDTNLSPSCLQWLLNFTSGENIPCVVEPVSVPKAAKLSELNLQNLFLITPNEAELSAIHKTAVDFSVDAYIDSIKNRGVQHIWLRQGESGSVMFMNDEKISLLPPKVKVIDTTGAGDAALAGWVHGYLKNASMIECMQYGHTLAALVLEQKGAILKNLIPEILEKKKQKLYPHVIH